jgi:hypothetical protein
MLEMLDKSRLWHIGNRYARRTPWSPPTDPLQWKPGDPVKAPLKTYHCIVDPEWMDYNGHMTEAAYLTAFGFASDMLFRYIGIDESYRASGTSYYTVETAASFSSDVSRKERRNPFHH